LQALNASGVLKNVHYLSTISGGGYIGTAMTVAMSLSGGTFPFGKTGQDIGETPETRHLRDNSRYLLQDGARSLISAAAIYMRGIVMNVIVVLPFLFAAAAALVLLKPDTAALSSPWSWMKDLPAVFREGFMPLSSLGLAGVLALLLVYAIGVSMVPIISLQKRRRIAFVAAIVMFAFGVVVFLEVHLLLLRDVFASHGSMTFPVSPGSPANVQVADTVVERAGRLLAWMTPFVLAVLPFLKSIAAKAVSESAGGLSKTLKRWISRSVLFVAAAVVPLLLWLTMLQLAYWGIGISTCVAPTTGPDCVMQDTWTHAPAFLRHAFAYASPTPANQIDHSVGLGYLLAAASLLVFWFFLNVNANSLYQLYRDRLGGRPIRK
jgi:hypothetical protein